MSKNKKKQHKDKQPNFLIVIVDELRFQTIYENQELKKWRRRNLRAQELLRNNGMEFLNHYIGSAACAPSRTTLFTGQYPSLHGVTQTTGAAKGGFDPDVFWLDPNTVPTMGDYFQKAGYRTFWKGKWHLSDEDILIPGTHDALPSYDPNTGVPDPEIEEIYLHANRFDAYGFSGWIGPEPHGANPRNSGSSAASGVSGRDEVYAKETVQLIKSLEEDKSKASDKPWLIVSSFVNPHDITLFGLATQASPNYNFELDPSLPDIPPAPTAEESFVTKPKAQRSYKQTYPKTFQPTLDTLFYRQLYYSLMKKVDGEILKVFRALKNSKFYEDTIVIFTSDHGDMLGAHGGLFQKWYNAYEETVHVPCIIHSPKLFKERETTEMLTSHVDLLPTMLGLAGINANRIQRKLKSDHTEVHPLVGHDLSSYLQKKDCDSQDNEALYFMTDDDVSKGLNQVTLSGNPYESVIQPNHIETVITKLHTGENGKEEIWKLSRYFDNPQFWSDPGNEDQEESIKSQIPIDKNTSIEVSVVTTKTEPVPDEYELYNLANDPLEEYNLAHPSNTTKESKAIQHHLTTLLEEQRNQKRLSPNSDG